MIIVQIVIWEVKRAAFAAEIGPILDMPVMRQVVISRHPQRDRHNDRETTTRRRKSKHQGKNKAGNISIVCGLSALAFFVFTWIQLVSAVSQDEISEGALIAALVMGLIGMGLIHHGIRLWSDLSSNY